MMRKLRILLGVLRAIVCHPIQFLRYTVLFDLYHQGLTFGRGESLSAPPRESAANNDNPLIRFYLEGSHRGMTKWCHYLEAYLPHFEQLRSSRSTLRILEIGIFSGGSLDMYRDFFLNQHLEIVAVDIDPECRSFAQPGVTIEIGDQEDRAFWDGFVRRHAPFDIIIDDGGHTAQQQVATLECMFNHVTPGGLYIVEDTLGVTNKFLGYVAGIVAAYNLSGNNDRGTVSPTSLQQMVARIEAVPGAFLFVRHGVGTSPAELHSPWRGHFWTRAARRVFEAHNPGQDPPLT